MECPPTMGVTTTFEQQNHCSGISPTMGVTTLEHQNHSSGMSPNNGSNNNLRAIEQQNHLWNFPYNGSNNNIRTIEPR